MDSSVVVMLLLVTDVVVVVVVVLVTNNGENPSLKESNERMKQAQIVAFKDVIPNVKL
jgi:hypothetical protein